MMSWPPTMQTRRSSARRTHRHVDGDLAAPLHPTELLSSEDTG